MASMAMLNNQRVITVWRSVPNFDRISKIFLVFV
jgi:hypothetical protein